MTGSIVKVGDNKYRIFISNGFRLDGRRDRRSKTITTDLKGRDLKKFLELEKIKFAEEISKKDPRLEKLSKGTFEAYSIWWLEYKKVSDKTKDGYKYLLNSRILPYIKDKRLDRISTGDMLELMKIIETTPSKKTNKPLSTRTIKHYHTLLKNMFNDAKTLKLISNNPMDNVPVQSPNTQLQDNYYDLDDIDQLLKVLPNAPIKYQLAILLTLTTGLRLGELSALQWKHIDTINCTVKIEQVNSYANNKCKIIRKTKTDSSRRQISFPRSLVDLIENHREDELLKKELMGDKWFYGKDNKDEDDFVFTTENGKVVFVETISDWFRRFRRKHNLKDITFHGLRHTSTTILISSGINVKNIASRLGHSRTSTTTDFYAHALESVERESANIFDNIIKNSVNGTESGTKKASLKMVK